MSKYIFTIAPFARAGVFTSGSDTLSVVYVVVELHETGELELPWVPISVAPK